MVECLNMVRIGELHEKEKKESKIIQKILEFKQAKDNIDLEGEKKFTLSYRFLRAPEENADY